MKITGSGEIEEVVKGKVYRIRHHLGRDLKTGRYIRSPKKTVHGTKADARRALEEYRLELERGVKNAEELAVGAYARAWYERRVNSGRYSPLTLKDDELQVRKIEDLWGTTLLQDLTMKKISDAYDKLLAQKKASRNAIHKLNGALSQVMDEAVANELVGSNPCEHVKAPRPRAKERRALSDEQALELAVALRTEEQAGCTVAVWIALATGMRRGEILGLVWRNVDFDRKRVYVGQQYAADHRIRDPKSEKSHRWLGLDDGTVAFLAEWRQKQARAMEVAGRDQAGETPVCTNAVFKFMDPNTFNRWRRQYFADHGLGEFGPAVQYTDSTGRKRWRKGAYVGYNLHELRHTQATLLIGSGADIKTVQQRLGHSSASLTMDIYAHFIAQNDRQAANTIGEILTEPSGSEDAPQKPTLSDADRAAIAQRMADGASLEAAISAVRPDVSVLDLLGLQKGRGR